MKKVTTQDYNFIRKWSKAIAKEGYVQVPNLLIRHLGDMKITPVEFAVIVGLLSHMWDEKNPYPAVETIASYIGRSRNSTQAAARSLDFNKGKGKGLVLRIPRGNMTNEYDIRPLVKQLESYAQPIEKLIPSHRKVDSSTYREVDTEEYHPNKTQEKRRRTSSGKLVPLKDVLMEKFLGMANKS